MRAFALFRWLVKSIRVWTLGMKNRAFLNQGLNQGTKRRGRPKCPVSEAREGRVGDQVERRPVARLGHDPQPGAGVLQEQRLCSGVGVRADVTVALPLPV